MTCLNSPLENYSNSGCSYAYQYYPLFLQKSLSEIACVKLYHKVGSNTDPQYIKMGFEKPLAFVFFMKLESPITNDYPF